VTLALALDVEPVPALPELEDIKLRSAGAAFHASAVLRHARKRQAVQQVLLLAGGGVAAAGNLQASWQVWLFDGASSR
jgi:hypothetical protein